MTKVSQILNDNYVKNIKIAIFSKVWITRWNISSGREKTSDIQGNENIAKWKPILSSSKLSVGYIFFEL